MEQMSANPSSVITRFTSQHGIVDHLPCCICIYMYPMITVHELVGMFFLHNITLYYQVHTSIEYSELNIIGHRKWLYPKYG